MRTRVLCAGCVLAFVYATVCTPITAAEPAVDKDATTEVVTIADANPTELFPLPEEYEVQVHIFDETGAEIGGVADNPDQELVYSNTSGQFVFAPGTNRLIADDMSTVAVGGCDLSRFDLTVSGRGDGTGDGFWVEVKVYDACPGAGGVAIWPASGFAHYDLPNDGTHLISQVLDTYVPTPSEMWIAMQFSRSGVGWVAGAPAFTGFTRNEYHYPLLPCHAKMTGRYAGFWAEAFCAPPFDREFIAYYNPGLDGGTVTAAGINNWITDDVTLIVEDCELSALEVAVGVGALGPYTANVQLWDPCGPNNLIPGTERVYQGTSTGTPDILRFEYLTDGPDGLHGIELNDDGIYVAWKLNTTGGPIMSGEATLGSTQDIFGLVSGTACNFYYYPGGPYSGFNVTVKCLGEAPKGACCDQTGDIAVCTEDVPEIGCQGAARRWVEGASCDNPSAFDPPCNTSACCKPNDTCQNLTKADCVAINDGLGHSALWQRARYCFVGDQHCPLFVCTFAEGACDVPHDNPGCNNRDCCDFVCRRDSFCCDWDWDFNCVQKATSTTNGCNLPPSNDTCATALDMGEEDLLPSDPNHLRVQKSNKGGSTSADDPGFCCHPTPGSLGAGSIWYTFTVPSGKSSARITTCFSPGGAGGDSLIGVYEGTCGNLTPVGCNDDGGCGDDGRLSDLHLFNLTPNATYWVVLASKTSGDTGTYNLDVYFPSNHAVPPAGNTCVERENVTTGNSYAFNMSNATLDCPTVPCGPDDDEDFVKDTNADLWYQVLVPRRGILSVDTCDPTGDDDPATVLMLYEGGECGLIDEIICNDDAAHCAPGSQILHSVSGLSTYTVRVGNEGALGESGSLNVKLYEDCNGNGVPDPCDISCAAEDGMCTSLAGCGQSTDNNANDVPDDCESCPTEIAVTFNPADGYVDAREPHPLSDAGTQEGLDAVTVTVPALAADASCWALCETANNAASHPGMAANGIQSITDNGNGTYDINLTHPLTPGEVTTLTYLATGAVASFTALPADVNADGTASAADLLVLIDSLNGVTPLPIDRTDMDRDGAAVASDILALINLLNGASAYEPWLNVEIDPTGCP